MKKPTTQKTESEQKSKPTGFNWHEHKDFVEWWKEHKESGFVQDNEGKWRWNITPPEAWRSARYRSEFTGHDEYYTLEQMQR